MAGADNGHRQTDSKNTAAAGTDTVSDSTAAPPSNGTDSTQQPATAPSVQSTGWDAILAGTSQHTAQPIATIGDEKTANTQAHSMPSQMASP